MIKESLQNGHFLFCPNVYFHWGPLLIRVVIYSANLLHCLEMNLEEKKKIMLPREWKIQRIVLLGVNSEAFIVHTHRQKLSATLLLLLLLEHCAVISFGIDWGLSARLYCLPPLPLSVWVTVWLLLMSDAGRWGVAHFRLFAPFTGVCQAF